MDPPSEGLIFPTRTLLSAPILQKVRALPSHEGKRYSPSTDPQFPKISGDSSTTGRQNVVVRGGGPPDVDSNDRMKLRIAVIDPALSLRHEISVSARHGLSGRALAEFLNHELGRTVQLHVAGRPLASCHWGEAPLTDGATLTMSSSSASEGAGPYLVCVEGAGCGAFWSVRRGTTAVGRDVTGIRIDNGSLAPEVGAFVIDNSGISFISRSRPSAARKIPGEGWNIAGSILRVIHDLRQAHPKPSDRAIPRAHVQLRSSASGWKTLLATMLIPVAAGLFMAWMWNFWAMAIFSAVSALTSLSLWWARSGGPGKNRRVLRAARQREIAQLDAVCPPLGFRLAKRMLLLYGARTFTSLSSASPDSLPIAGSGLWIRWGRGTRSLHITSSPENSAPRFSGMPILTCINSPHLIRISSDGGPDGLDILRAHLVAAGIPMTWLSCGRDCKLCRVVSERCDFTSTVHGQIHGSVDLSCARRIEAANGPRPQIVITFDEDPVIPPPDWDGIIVRPTVEGLRLSVQGNAGDSLVGFCEGYDVVCLQPDFPDTAVVRSLTPFVPKEMRDDVWQPFLSAREDLAVERLRERWVAHRLDSRLFLDIGISPHHGKMIRIDLNQHGPHALVAGTTGSGKSEFLRGALYCLALTYPPDRVGLVLIDFKGGTSFGPAIRLPHVHACITDLDGGAVDRALSFLEAEVRRRESLFQAAGCLHWREFTRAKPHAPGHCRLPEIMIVIDEFRHLVDSFPASLQRFLRIAAAGRSLGMHLILSTQRPQGAISQDIRANTSMEVCFRVTADQESMSVLGDTSAAKISATSPGRGILRFDGKMQEFQSVLVDSLPRLPPPEPMLVADDGNSHAVSELDDRNLNMDTGRVAAEASRHRARIRPVIPPPCGTPTLDFWEAWNSSSWNEGTERPLVLGPAECPHRAWQDTLLWRPHQQGGISFEGAAPDQFRLLATLLATASIDHHPVYLIIFDRAIRHALDSWVARGMPIFGLGDSSSPEYCLEMLRELTRMRCPPSQGRPLVVVQGLDRWCEELLKHGTDFSPAVEDLLNTRGNSWAMAVLSGSRVPSRLSSCLPNRLSMKSPTSPVRSMSLPLEDSTRQSTGCQVEGPITDDRGVVELTLPAVTSLSDFPRRALPQPATPVSRKILTSFPQFRDLPENLRWDEVRASTHIEKTDNHRHLRAVSPSPTTDGGTILLGISAPQGQELALPWRCGEVIGVLVGGSESHELFIQVISTFHDAAELNVFTPDRGSQWPYTVMPTASWTGRKTKLAVVASFMDWRHTEREELQAVVSQHDAAVVLIPSSTLALPPWWSDRVSAASCSLLIGSGPPSPPFGHGRPSEREYGKRRFDEGALFKADERIRFKLPQLRKTSTSTKSQRRAPHSPVMESVATGVQQGHWPEADVTERVD
ncbi:hypothetical protein D8M21_02525 [Kocuria sp. HSID16901]|nr:hypothetical protein D8M21_02525 [Kocuria sp. HSID16901]